MTLSKEELSGLVERVRGLKGADREVDAAMAKIAGWHPNGYGCKMPDDVPAYWYSDAFGLPSYTGSVDAALALVERVQPGWKWNIGHEANGELHATIWNGVWEYDEYGATAPLAIVLALLLSLQS